MSYLIYSSTGYYNNGNTDWISNLLQKEHKQLKYFGLAAFTALSIYILTPSLFGNRESSKMFSSSKRSDKFTTGLINNRNDCFANSSVQALSALPKLTTYMNDLLKQVLFLRSLLDRSDGGNTDAKDGDGSDAVAALSLKTPHLEKPNPFESSLAPEDSRPNLHAHRPHGDLQSFSSTATITTMSTLEEARHGQGHGTTTGDTSAAQSTCESSVSKENGISTASSEQIPEVPLHEGLAQVIYQLQQVITTSKYISVWPFLHVLEVIFDAKISAGQNDAHELTQVILETLEQENMKVKKFVKEQNLNVIIPDFPVKGSLADHLICLSCQGSSKVNVHPFTMYPLPVPQEVSANLSAMIADNQTETIEGYACLSCKIKAILANEEQRDNAADSKEETMILKTLSDVVSDIFINEDLSEDLMNYINNYKKDGCDASSIKSRIIKKTVVTESPDILILHLSRSVFNGTTYTRNACYVNFEDELHTQEQDIQNNRCVGVKPVKYKLKAMVKHQGTHSQGHYECYRRKPDLIKDALSGQVVNRSPTIDFGLASNRNAAIAWNQTANMPGSDLSSVSSQESENSPTVPFRTVFPESTQGMPLAAPVVDDDDYIVGQAESGSSTGPSRKPSTLQKLTGFLSRRSSVASTASDGNKGDSVAASDAGPTPRRSRVNSVASLESSAWGSSSGADMTETSASECDEPASAIKRKLKKIKSVINYPFWKLSDAAVREAKTDEVLNDTKYVYILYYDRVDEVEKA
ncbi:LANO_0E08922g1_1 [Lachancea nothofagi CBS 11611]|uniref:LANO_0E08922g1_1 n=1 Tax=Lachancea nothofagi CBS 11611 TaxID=1266666 RepID=A0A1G4JVE5_9SACH|nr:LANO_0E08922g1_1 [Lachancea nothofagi CBS 11611]